MSEILPTEAKDSTSLLHAPFVTSITMDSQLSSSISIPSDEQLIRMIINENSAPLSQNVLTESGLNMTPSVFAKFLFALCESSKHEANGQQPNRGPEDIDTLAVLCCESLPSASPLADIIKAIDDESFVRINHNILSFEGSGKPFQRFWQFCINLCNSDKQGTSYHDLIICAI